MCGINGFVGSDNTVIEKMNEVTRHRGPDATGVFVDSRVSLGHNLLSITDTPSASRQPFVSDDKRFVMLYNGEIYNYKTLRDGLEKIGCTFRTDSDTEVLFQGLQRHGRTFLDELDGMFAVAWYDTQQQQLLLARDRSGIKPLYYYDHGGSFIFSSEYRGIFAHGIPRVLDQDAAAIFFMLGYIPGTKTFIRHISKVAPGQYIEYNIARREKQVGWIAAYDRQRYDVTYDPAGFRTMIGESVVRHTQGLRPFGLYLSGGMDSSMIFHELATRKGAGTFRTYTTRFDTQDPRYNEDADIAKRLSSEYGVEHHELLVTEKDFLAVAEKTIETIEEPRWNPNIPAYWLLAQAASKDIVVVLNGSGGDELFFGYSRYLASARIAEYYKKFPAFAIDAAYTIRGTKKRHIFPGHWLALSSLVQRWAYFHGIRSRVDEVLFPGLPKTDITTVAAYLSTLHFPSVDSPLSDPENAVAEYDRNFWLVNEEFIRTDKITMKFGMEGRFPLLARDIVRYANSIPAQVKYTGGTLKYMARTAYTGHLPDYVVQKQKTGWTAPVGEWMNGAYGRFIQETLTPSYYPPTAELFDLSAFQKKVKNNTVFTTDKMKPFLPVATFQMWARAFGITLS